MTRAQGARLARRQAARQRIIDGLPGLRDQSLLSISDIAWRTGVAQSTVRRHIESLIRDEYLKYTSYVRYYGLGRNSRHD